MLNLKSLGINEAAYDDALRATERLTRIIVHVRSSSGNETLTGSDSVVMSGAVNVDADADVSRSCEMTLLDPGRTLMFESSKQPGSLWPDCRLRVEYGIRLANKTWADVPIFYGRLSSYDRSGDTVELSAQGSEADHIAPAFMGQTLHIGKRAQVNSAIRRILAAHGENRFALDDGKRQIVGDVDLTAESEPWLVCRRIARDADRHLFFDAEGYVRLRKHPGPTPVFEFTESEVTSGPGQSFQMENLRNVVRVTGKTPDGDGKKEPPHATALPRASDPLHPSRLGLKLIEFIQADNVSGENEAQRLADRRLDAFLRQAITADFTAVPVPHLQELDQVRINAAGVSITFPLRQFSIPLDGGEMSVGSTKFVRLRRRATKKHPHKGGGHR